jgi:hypothetical protein
MTLRDPYGFFYSRERSFARRETQSNPLLSLYFFQNAVAAKNNDRGVNPAPEQERFIGGKTPGAAPKASGLAWIAT